MRASQRRSDAGRHATLPDPGIGARIGNSRPTRGFIRFECLNQTRVLIVDLSSILAKSPSSRRRRSAAHFGPTLP